MRYDAWPLLGRGGSRASGPEGRARAERDATGFRSTRCCPSTAMMSASRRFRRSRTTGGSAADASSRRSPPSTAQHMRLRPRPGSSWPAARPPAPFSGATAKAGDMDGGRAGAISIPSGLRSGGRPRLSFRSRACQLGDDHRFVELGDGVEDLAHEAPWGCRRRSCQGYRRRSDRYPAR